MPAVSQVVLIGFSGTGKSTVARLLAERLGWDAIDTDLDIERHWGVSIPTIFADHGEAAFRASERLFLGRALAEEGVVVATGGGAAVTPAAWDVQHLGRPGTLVVALDAASETILARLTRQAAAEGAAVERPMLAGTDPLGRIAALKAERQAVYDKAHLTLPVDSRSAEEVASEIATLLRGMNGGTLAIHLEAESASSEIEIAPGLLRSIGERVRARWPKAQRAWLITDDNVGPLHAPLAEESLQAFDFSTATFAVQHGEGSKSLARLSELYDWLLGGGVERGDVILALGGGVVGDLAGFAAATVLRGVSLVQIPTSLLAAVDSSVGGKTGINHATGKNLIGSFLQPHLVIVDTELLRTMPPRELRSGWAEVVKHAIIQRSTPGGERGDLMTFLERNADRLLSLSEPAISYLVWRNIALKAAVVAADEREQGIRAYLNFGHTLGHAIEAADYRLLHGEAVAVGMIAASYLGIGMDTCGAATANQIRGLVERFGLPTSASADEDAVLRKLITDKKRVAGRQRFVLPLEDGGVVLRDDVPDALVLDALRAVNLTATPA